MKWTMEFDEYGGYDCMSGAWAIRSAAGKTIVKVDQGDYGQKTCDYTFKSPEAEEIARLITAAPEMLAALRECITDDGAYSMTRRDVAALKMRIAAINAVAKVAIAIAEGKI